MTEVKPPSMQLLQVSKSGPWSRCRHDGDVGALDDSGLHQLHQIGVVGIGAGALGHLEDQGALTSWAASVMPWTISMLLTLKIPLGIF